MRGRITAVTAAAVAAGLAIIGLAFVGVLGTTLTASEATTAEQLAEQLADRLEATGGTRLDDVEDGVAQVQRDGVVLATSDDDVAQPLPLEGLARTDEGEVVTSSTDAEIGGAELDVVVARDLEQVAAATTTVGALLALLLPLLTAAIALTVWVVVGRALRPVDRIRRDVDAIGSAQLDRRVDVPPTRDEVATLARTMNRMLDRLEQAQLAQRRFLSDASHELRSPVASLAQHAQLAQQHPGATDLATLAEVVDAESTRLTELVESMLALTRAEEGAPRREAVDLDDLALAEAARLRAETGLSISTAGVSAVQLIADPAALRRALRNLGDNARRHAATSVSIATSREGGTAVIAVEDDGPGVPEHERQRVLERFHRLDDARSRDAGGSGLGLAIVAGTAAAHGGEVRILASALGGARAEIRLPLGLDASISPGDDSGPRPS